MRLIISGRVQGVFFRVSTRDQALKIAIESSQQITGWVRNKLDGTVEATFQGSNEVVDNLIAWCNTGPSGSNVSSVKVINEDIITTEIGYQILPTN